MTAAQNTASNATAAANTTATANITATADGSNITANGSWPVRVRVPANTMLMGEHSVLFGHKALCCAIDTYLTVSARRRSDGYLKISSALGDYECDLVEVLSQDVADWPQRFAFVCEAVRTTLKASADTTAATTAQAGVGATLLAGGGFDIMVTSDFSHTIGLGSSAAVTAGVVAAITALYSHPSEPSQQPSHPSEPGQPSHPGRPSEPGRDLGSRRGLFDLSLKTVRSVQGRGSGSDLIASIYGAITSFDPVSVTAKTLPFPGRHDTDTDRGQSGPSAVTADGLRLDLFYCGYKTPTVDVLSQVESQRRRGFAGVHDGLYSQMGAVTETAEEAVLAGDWQRVGACMNHYHGLLDALGVCDSKLCEMVYEARSNEGVLGAKISGSGLGDCIITLSRTSSEPPVIEAAQSQFGATIAREGLLLL